MDGIGNPLASIAGFPVTNNALAGVALVAPSDSASLSVSDPIAFKWRTSGKANEYRIQLSGSPDFESSPDFTVPAPDTTLTLPSEALKTGISYYWRVRAGNELGNSAWSDTLRFSLMPITLEPVTLLSPPDEATFPLSDIPEFQWTSSDGAEEYIVQWSESPTFTFAENATVADTAFAPESGLFEAGRTYHWRVQAVSEEGSSVWSDTLRFSLMPITLAPVTLLTPPDEAAFPLSDIPEFQWTSSDGAEEYIVQWSESPIFRFAENATVTDTAFAPESGLLEAGKTYHWRVQAMSEEGSSAWSDTLRFSVISTALPTPEPVALLSPADDTTFSVKDIPEFRWTSSEAADSYRFQLSNGGFIPLIDTTLSTANDTTFTLPEGILQPETTYYWRVQAVNEGGGSAWSEVYRFMTTMSVSNEGEERPLDFTLSQNYPNPFNPVTQIRYSLPEAVFVRLEVRNILGQRVATLVNERKNAGHYVVSLDGSTLSSGVYFYTIEAGDFRETHKMLLIK